MAVGTGFFKSFKKCVLGGEIERVGRGNHEKAFAGFAILGEREKIAQGFNGDDGSFGLGLVGAEIDWEREA